MQKRARALIAIDGPAGAGKSTVARRVAEALGFLLVDTGALYRSVALATVRAGLSYDELDAIASLASDLARDRRIRLEPAEANTPSSATNNASSVGGSGVRVVLDGDDVSRAIRTPEISLGASRVSAIPGVRDALLSLQRQAGEQGGVVLEGRDIGTVVFPDAEVKVFLTASSRSRAERRFRELEDKGQGVSLEATLEEVEARDRADTLRPIAPLRRADDAVEIDSSDATVDEVVDRIVALAKRA
jgi:cytidylate kinase